MEVFDHNLSIYCPSILNMTISSAITSPLDQVGPESSEVLIYVYMFQRFIFLSFCFDVFCPRDSFFDIAGGKFLQNRTRFSIDSCTQGYDSCSIIRLLDYRDTRYSQAITPPMLLKLIQFVILFSNCSLQQFDFLICGLQFILDWFLTYFYQEIRLAQHLHNFLLLRTIKVSFSA